MTQHKRPAFLVLSRDDYQRLLARDTRRHYVLKTVSDGILEKAKAENARLERQGGS